MGRIRKRILPKDRSGPAHDRYLSLISLGAAGPELLQQVPEHKHGKNRLHLDLRTRDLDAEVDRVQQAGATRLAEQPIEESGWRWHVLADPKHLQALATCTKITSSCTKSVIYSQITTATTQTMSTGGR